MTTDHKTLQAFVLADLFMIGFASVLILAVVGGVSLISIRLADQSESPLDTPIPSVSSQTATISDLEQKIARLRAEAGAFSQFVVNLNSEREAFQAEKRATEKRLAKSQIEMSVEKERLTKERDELHIKAQNQGKETEIALRSTKKATKLMNAELLGFKGSLERMAFVVDTSGSMAKRSTFAKAGLWPEVVVRVHGLIQHLPIEEFQIICFDSKPRSMSRECVSASSENRTLAKDFLSSQIPKGYTLTQDALEQSLRFNPTAIILVTDGAPSDTQGRSDIEQQRRLIKAVGESRFPPINVIAVGDDLTETGYGFLRQLATQSGGSFSAF